MVEKLITKADLVDVIYERLSEDIEYGMPKKKIKVILETAFNTIAELLKDGYKVRVGNLGSFEVKRMPAKKGRNPRTGEEIDIPERNAVKFRVGKKLKDTVNC